MQSAWDHIWPKMRVIMSDAAEVVAERLARATHDSSILGHGSSLNPRERDGAGVDGELGACTPESPVGGGSAAIQNALVFPCRTERASPSRATART